MTTEETITAPEYIFEASDKPSLPLHPVPLVHATDDTVKGYGCLVDNPNDIDIEIVQWPAQGWRSVDPGTGDEAGWVEGIFTGEWRGDVLFGTNEAVSGHYVLGWSVDPQSARSDYATAPREHVLLWHMNYHPDGGHAACIFIPMFGTKGFFRRLIVNVFSTDRVVCTPV